MDRSRKRLRSPSADYEYADADASSVYRSRWDRGPEGGRSRERDHDRDQHRRRSELDPDPERYRQRAGSPGYEAWLDEQEAIVFEHERQFGAGSASGAGAGAATAGAGASSLGSASAGGVAADASWQHDHGDRTRERRNSRGAFSQDHSDRSPSSRRTSERISSASGNIIDRYVPSYSNNGAGSSGTVGSGGGAGSRRYDDVDPRDARDRERDHRQIPHHLNTQGTPTKPRDPLEEESMLNFKAFCAFVRAHDATITRETTTAELYEKHQAYKREFNRRAIERFWREHRTEAWFQERYSLDEELVQARKERRRKGREGRKENWLKELQSGLLDPITFDAEDAPPVALQQRLMPSESSSSIWTVNTASSLPTPSSTNNTQSPGRSALDAPPDTPTAAGVPHPRAGGADPSKSATGEIAGGASTKSGSLTPILQELTFKRHGITPSPEKDLVQIPAESSQILLVNLPTTLARKDVDAVFANEPGFRYVAYGEVNALKRWSRIAWVMFEEGTDVRDIVKRLDKSQAGDITLNMAVADRPATGRRRVTPEYANSIERLTKDLEQAKQIVAAVEAEDRELFSDLLAPSKTADGDANAADAKAAAGGGRAGAEWLHVSASYEIEKRCQTLGLGMDVLEANAGDAEDQIEKRREVLKKHLDLHLDLLRVVYHCDYYLGAMCDFPEELVRRVPRHVRKVPAAGVNIESPRDHTNDESWAKTVDSKASLLISTNDVDVEEYGGKNAEKILLAAAAPYVQEENPEKYRCSVPANGGVCNKAFKAALFVQKHVMNKHRPVLDTIVGEEVKEALELNQLALDPSRVQLARSADNAPHANGHSGTHSTFNSPSARSSLGDLRRHHHESDGGSLAHRLSGSGPANGTPILNGSGNSRNGAGGAPFGFQGAQPVMAPGLQQMAAFAAMQFGMPMNPGMIAAMAAAGMKEMARNMGLPGLPGAGGSGPLGGANGAGSSSILASAGAAAGSAQMGPGGAGPRLGSSPRTSSSSTLPSAVGAGLPARPQTNRPRVSEAESAASLDGAQPAPKRAALEPLPAPPSGPDPRARRSQRSYEDLDGAASGGDVQLQY
ncbi:hypothetical protein OC834_001129 [Tilletia horrida]|nr:hypothetical protein OC834_001129 [Tilletia horrida]